MDETLALPSDQAVKVALRTQQIIAEETGVADIIDPLGGSYFVEYLTDEIERQALNYIKQLDEIGGMLNAIETGFVQKEIADASFQFQKELERGERVIVGVNKYVDDLEPTKIPLLKIDPEMERIQVEKVKKFKRERDSDKVKMYQTALKQCCLSGKNIMPLLIEAVDIFIEIQECFELWTKKVISRHFE
jgi:methylmalonyl-CoA mutase N-terminal domain/subunit